VTYKEMEWLVDFAGKKYGMSPQIEQDNYGQYIIYTGLTDFIGAPPGGTLRQMTDADFGNPLDHRGEGDDDDLASFGKDLADI